ncbi:class I SAM-dependent methyltransferase [Candidatus Pelagibacter sp.]|nr:class I SAM-dependent methyltransferase [Candidatus Pelagibacter sp.]
MSEFKNKISKNVSIFFDGYAHDFSSIYKEDTKKRSSFDKLMDKWFRKGIRDRFNITVNETKKDTINSILDIGCGPGHFVVKFLEQGKKVTALDIAPSMIEITKKRVQSMGKEDEVKFILEDYLEYKPTEKFDAVCVMGFFDYVEDPVIVLKKLINDVNKEIYISIPDNKGLLAWQRKIRYNQRNCPLFLYSRKFLEDSLKKAGCFEISEIVEIDRGYFVTIRK